MWLLLNVTTTSDRGSVSNKREQVSSVWLRAMFHPIPSNYKNGTPAIAICVMRECVSETHLIGALTYCSIDGITSRVVTRLTCQRDDLAPNGRRRSVLTRQLRVRS